MFKNFSLDPAKDDPALLHFKEFQKNKKKQLHFWPLQQITQHPKSYKLHSFWDSRAYCVSKESLSL